MCVFDAMSPQAQEDGPQMYKTGLFEADKLTYFVFVGGYGDPPGVPVTLFRDALPFLLPLRIFHIVFLLSCLLRDAICELKDDGHY